MGSDGSGGEMIAKVSLDLDTLCRSLGYQFRDRGLLELALTHRSHGVFHNERLEFLGDALLNFLTADRLYKEYSDLSEGGLSRLRANLVNGEVLAQLAAELNINHYLRLGAGEMKSGGENRRSILSNTMEAVIGSIFLDGGIDACRERIYHWYEERFAAITEEGVKKDSKTLLQEYVQSKKMSLPHYEILSIEGKEHNQLFRVQCRIPDTARAAVGQGTSRRRAEQEAAQKLLALLK